MSAGGMNLMAFLSKFASYIIVFVIFVAVAAVAVILGVTVAKKREAKKLAEEEHVDEELPFSSDQG